MLSRKKNEFCLSLEKIATKVDKHINMKISNVSVCIIHHDEQDADGQYDTHGQEQLKEEIRQLRSRNEDLELEIREVDRRHNLLRCWEYERVDGWTRHLSWEDRPGTFYWYCEETGETQWDGDEDGEVNEPDWWSLASN